MTIGIVVLLAGGLFLMVRIFTDRDRDEVSKVTFQRDETADSLQVLHTEVGARRSNLQVRASVAGDFDVGPPAGGDALPANEFVTMGGATDGPPDADLSEGTTFYFCATTGPVANVKVDIKDINTNSIIWRGEFTSLGQCSA